MKSRRWKNRSALILKSTIQITVQKKWKHQQKVCTKFDGTYMQGKHEIHSEWECSDAKKQDLLFVQTNKTETSFDVIHMLGIRTHNFFFGSLFSLTGNNYRAETLFPEFMCNCCIFLNRFSLLFGINNEQGFR